MRLSKFLALTSCVTFFCLAYVWQQTKIYSLAYASQKSLARFQDLLDENSVLRYNLKKDTSLVRLGSKVCGNTDFQMPNSYCLVRSEGLPASGASRASLKRLAVVSRMFGVRRQAEAKTINPSINSQWAGQGY